MDTPLYNNPIFLSRVLEFRTFLVVWPCIGRFKDLNSCRQRKYLKINKTCDTRVRGGRGSIHQHITPSHFVARYGSTTIDTPATMTLMTKDLVMNFDGSEYPVDITDTKFKML